MDMSETLSRGAVFRVDSTADLLMSGNLASAMQRVSSFKELVAL